MIFLLELAGPCVQPESCDPTLGVRRCHLPYLEFYLPHSLLRSETVDLAMSVACRRLPSALILGARADSLGKEKFTS
jgi:hypothetical protein